MFLKKNRIFLMLIISIKTEQIISECNTHIVSVRNLRLEGQVYSFIHIPTVVLYTT